MVEVLANLGNVNPSILFENSSCSGHCSINPKDNNKVAGGLRSMRYQNKKIVPKMVHELFQFCPKMNRVELGMIQL